VEKDGRVVDQDVELSDLARDPGAEVADRFFVRRVENVRHRGLADFFRRGVGGVLRPAGDDHGEIARRELPRYFRSDSSTRAGDEGHRVHAISASENVAMSETSGQPIIRVTGTRFVYGLCLFPALPDLV